MFKWIQCPRGPMSPVVAGRMGMALFVPHGVRDGGLTGHGPASLDGDLTINASISPSSLLFIKTPFSFLLYPLFSLLPFFSLVLSPLPNRNLSKRCCFGLAHTHPCRITCLEGQCSSRRQRSNDV